MERDLLPSTLYYYTDFSKAVLSLGWGCYVAQGAYIFMEVGIFHKHTQLRNTLQNMSSIKSVQGQNGQFLRHA